MVTPQLTPTFRFQLRQHLLQGFGFDPNLRYIRIARNNREITDVVFRQQIITTVSQVENIYWDLVTAYEAVQVNQRALQLAEKVLSDDQEQVKIGTMAPITLAQAQSGVASAKQNLILSQTNLQLEQLLMKNAITKNMQDPHAGGSARDPDRHVEPNEQYEVRPVDELIARSPAGASGDCHGPDQPHEPGDFEEVDSQRPAADARCLCVLRSDRAGGSAEPAVPTCPDSIIGQCYQPGLIPPATARRSAICSTAPLQIRASV